MKNTINHNGQTAEYTGKTWEDSSNDEQCWELRILTGPRKGELTQTYDSYADRVAYETKIGLR